MRTSYDIRRRALTDIDGIRDYTRRLWGAAQARRYIAELRQIFSAASTHPNRYPLVDGRADGLRRARSGSHIVILVVDQGRVEIVRVLHERMDLDAQLD